MGRYLVLWEVEKDKVPLDPKERADGWLLLTNLVRQDMEKGLLKEWGTFTGEIGGFAVAEGTEVEIELMVNQYIPLVYFELRSLETLDQIEEVLKTMSG